MSMGNHWIKWRVVASNDPEREEEFEPVRFFRHPDQVAGCTNDYRRGRNGDH